MRRTAHRLPARSFREESTRHRRTPAAQPTIPAPLKPNTVTKLAAAFKRTKEDQVADFLREQIIWGFYARGQRLKQAEVAEMLDISITPVREALKILEAEGYVVGTSHKGAVVAPFQIERTEELLQLRVLLELRLTKAALAGIEPATLASLAALNAETEAARINDRDVNQAHQLSFPFHAVRVGGPATDPALRPRAVGQVSVRQADGDAQPPVRRRGGA